MRFAGLWRHPDFVRLWAAATVSTFGSLVTRTALPFAAILFLDATPVDLSLLVIAELGPGFVIGLVAGAWVDRLRRRPVLIAADLGRAALLMTIPIAALGDWLSLPQLLIVAAGGSLLTVIFDVAYLAYLPSLVRRQDILDANSKVTAAGAVAEAAAFSSGGWLVQWLTAPFAILVDAVTFLGSACIVHHPGGSAEPPHRARDRRGVADRRDEPNAAGPGGEHRGAESQFRDRRGALSPLRESGSRV
jgi:hypothetical protein